MLTTKVSSPCNLRSFVTDLPLLQQVKQNPQREQTGKYSIIGNMPLLDLSSMWAPLNPLCSAEEKKKLAGFEDLPQHLKGVPSQCSLDSFGLKNILTFKRTWTEDFKSNTLSKLSATAVSLLALRGLGFYATDLYHYFQF